MHAISRSAGLDRTPGLPLLARTVRGIEWIAAAEIRATLGATAIECAHREVRFSLSELTAAVLGLGTVDDVYLVAAIAEGIGRTRSELTRLATASETLDFDSLMKVVSPLRSPSYTRTFDITASFLGRHNFNRHDIEDTVGDRLTRLTNWTYLSRAKERVSPHRGLSLRVHLADSRATLAVRIGPRPLHRRCYRDATRPGVLHPPVARALALLAGLRASQRFLDPFCGVGTIVIEAKLACPRLRADGTDLDREAIRGARANARAARVRVSFLRADAGALPIEHDAIDRVATNPPWGSAVMPGGGLVYSRDLVWRELRRVLKPNGRAVVLLPAECATREIRAAGLTTLLENKLRLSGAVVAALVVAPRDSAQRELDANALFGRELNDELRRSRLWVPGP